MGDIKYVVTVDDKGFTQKIETFDRAIEGLGKSTKSTRAESKGFGTELMGELVPSFTAAQLAANGIQRMLGFVRTQYRAIIDESIEAEQVDRALEASIDIVGEAYGGAAARIQSYATAMMRKTIYDDEEIKTAQTLIVQMRGTSAGLADATKYAIGLASAFKMDLVSAARAVAQGLEGNYRQIGQMIPAVREATTETEKHAVMVREMSKYYLRAESDAKAFGGQLRSLKNEYGELMTTIGDFVTKNKDVLDTLSGTKELIIWLERNIRTLSETQEKSKGKISPVDFIGPMVLWRAYKAITEDAAKANKEYGESWKGYTEYYLSEGRRPLLEAPVLMQKIVTVQGQLGYSTASLKQELVGARAALSAAVASGAEAPGVIYALGQKVVELEGKLLGANRQLTEGQIRFDSLRLAAGSLRSEIIKPLRLDLIIMVSGLPAGGGPSAIVKWMSDAANAPKKYEGQFKRSLQEWAEDAETTFGKIGEAVQLMSSAISGAANQARQNAEISVENEYKRRLEIINKTITDEEAKQKAIVALEAEYEIKRSAARAKGAGAAKAVALMEATVNTASGMNRALKDFPWPLSLIIAGIVGAAGAIQVGLIAAQPVPLAKGGYFKEPTLLPGLDGRTYLTGEAGPEVTSPVPVMRQVVREELLALAPALAGGGRLTLNGGIHIHTPALNGSDFRRMGNDIWAELEYQASRRGISLGGRG